MFFLYQESSETQREARATSKNLNFALEQSIKSHKESISVSLLFL